MSKFQLLKGFKDLLPEEAPLWEWIESTAKNTFDTYGFSMIETPIVESADLFTQSIGNTTDIVEKDMYTFDDRDQKKISLRPEGTASVVRAYLTHPSLLQAPYVKLYYRGPMFRHERPQAGRLRQFHQIGAETIGDGAPHRDIELLAMLTDFFHQLKVTDLTLEINSLGCPTCRPEYRAKLLNSLHAHTQALCEECVRRLQTNPLRILDCKKESCRTVVQSAPAPIDHLCDPCATHFKAVEEGLSLLSIPYRLNRHLVRGIDYYTRTAFEMTTTHLGAQNAVAAGGRYDSLIELLGGVHRPAIGFAIGVERVVALINKNQVPQKPLTLFMIPLGSAARSFLLPVLYEIRSKKIKSEWGDEHASLKNQMKQADRLNARYALIIGEEELRDGFGILRNMTTREQEKVPLSHLAETLSARFCKTVERES
jgi:histidyl-tRNA synthetase